MQGTTHECRLVGVFQDTESAQRVVRELVENGFAQADIRLQASESPALSTSGSFWDEVRDLFGSEDAQAYREAEHRGNSVVVIRTPDDVNRVHVASEVMRRNDPIRVEGCSRGSVDPGGLTAGHRPDAVRVYRREIDTLADVDPKRTYDPHEQPGRVQTEDVDLGGRSGPRANRPADLD